MKTGSWSANSIEPGQIAWMCRLAWLYTDDKCLSLSQKLCYFASLALLEVCAISLSHQYTARLALVFPYSKLTLASRLAADLHLDDISEFDNWTVLKSPFKKFSRLRVIF